ncbi:hypothetical protein [Frigidibacter sp.]|uniref:hypothetical protein n=1 Tax=Frigidibacter sp. TaxID=2586418 RepID=UPI002733B268|nr:hypothetical protein [Frigidibacter sp.]MDP3340647.1 hypothetical protein [Frigidibacter sp.]
MALENLKQIHVAMLEACLGMNSAMAGMASAMEIAEVPSGTYEREQSKSTSHLLNFLALYSLYVDICRRIKSEAGIPKTSAPYHRAIRRITKSNWGKHSVTGDLRNYVLHYLLENPRTVIHINETRTVNLVMDANALLYSGFDWKSDAKSFLQTSPDLDVIEVTRAVAKDVARLIKFHENLVESRLSHQKIAYDTYIHERARFKHLQKSAVDMGRVIKRPTSMLSRLIDKTVIEGTINSALSDEDVRTVLCTLANKYDNLSADAMRNLTSEVNLLLRQRRRFPSAGAYLQGRHFPPPLR